MFENFFGNRAAAAALENMIESGRIPQTILLAGPEGVGKATLARRFAARLLGTPNSSKGTISAGRRTWRPLPSARSGPPTSVIRTRCCLLPIRTS